MDDKLRRVLVVAIAVIVVFGAFFGVHIANTRASDSANRRAEEVLLDSARELVGTFTTALNGDFQVLRSLAASLSRLPDDDASLLETTLDSIAADAGLSFASVDFLFADGSLATEDEEYDVMVSDRDYFVETLKGNATMERIVGRETGKVSVALAVPCYRNGEVYGVLRGLLYEDDLRELLLSEAYGGDGYSYLVCGHGNIIVNSESELTYLTSSNLIDALSGAKFREGSSLEGLRDALSSGASASVRYTFEGQPRVAVLTPLVSDMLPTNDWFLFNVVNEARLATEIRSATRDTMEVMLIFALFTLLAFGVMFLLEFDYRRKKHAEAEITRQREEQFRVVTEQSGKFVMRYDIPTKTSYRSDAASDGLGGTAKLENMAEETIRAGRVDPASIKDFREFFRKIDRGESPVAANLLIVRPDGERRWFRHVSTTIFDSYGNPTTAIISYYDDTEQRERELAYAQWRQELNSLSFENAALYEWDLTKDALDSQRGSLAISYSHLEEDTFDARSAYFAKAHVAKEDRAAFLSMINREHLVGMYYNKTYRCGMEYRYQSGDGQTRWREISVQLVPYPDNESIKAYVTNRDIDQDKRERLALLAKTQQDYLTGALNRETFMDRVRELLAKSPQSTHALLMLDIDGFKRINDLLGHEAGDRVLQDFVRYVRSVLRPGDIVGRIGGDEFMVCLPDMPFDSVIGKKASQLCSVSRRRLSGNLSISTSIGVAVYPRDGADFEELYHSADAALYRAKDAGKDGFEFFKKGMSGAYQLTDIDADTAKRARRPVLLATDSQDLASELEKAFGDEYEAIRVTDGESMLERYDSVPNACVALLDEDSETGGEILRSYGTRLTEAGLSILVLTSDSSDEAYPSQLAYGAMLVFRKPLRTRRLMLRLEHLYAQKERERSRTQSDYQRLRTTEETRYREVLFATGTTVFIYDVATRAYEVDLLASPTTAGSFDGKNLTEDLTGKGIIEKEDMAELRAVMATVAEGKAMRATHTVRLANKQGQRRWFRIQFMRMESADAYTHKLLITANDINEQFEANEALRVRAERDALTGLYNRETFLEKAGDLIRSEKPGHFVMCCFDIDNFKVINDRYGVSKGDEVLKGVASVFREGFEKAGGICCRVMADHFAVLYPLSFMDTEENGKIRKAVGSLDASIQTITFSIGRYIINDLSLPVSAMFDRASIAKNSVKGRFDKRIAFYDEAMREHILREQGIVGEMNAALRGGQFEVWLQPQYNHSTGALIGAEALARWRRPKFGLVPPGDFVPVFERNGFIYEMDKFVWERSCALLRKWIDEGRSPQPLSVNVSRYDLLREGFVKTLCELVERYRIPVDLLRLEITESAFSRSTDQIIGVVKRLIEYGFTVEIDDFGSGYSSLNTLKDVPASVLKLDMRFLESSENSTRGGNILESVVRMAKWLDMTVIAEGVETKGQADFLRSIGCNYMQGYLYAKPMPAEEYEALESNVAKEKRMLSLETVEALDNNAFWNPASMETLIFNSYVGGACIFEYENGRIEFLRVNEKYARELGGEKMTSAAALGLDLAAHMDERNVSLFRRCITLAVESNSESTCEICLHDFPADERRTYLRVTVRAIARAGDLLLVYGSIRNITAQRMTERRLLESSEQMRTIMDNVNGGVTAVIMRNDAPSFVYANDQYFEQLGYTREQFFAEVSSAFSLIHPEDRETVVAQTLRASVSKQPFSCVYRAVKRDGQIVWLRSNISITSFPGVEEPVQLSVANDITDQISSQQGLLESSRQLRFLNEVSRDLLSETDPGKATRMVLGKIREYFDGSRAYVCEFCDGGEQIRATFEAHSSGTDLPLRGITEALAPDAAYWTRAFEAQSHIFIDVESEPAGAGRDMLLRRGIASLVAVALRRDGKPVGFLCVDEPNTKRSHIDHMEALGDYMAVLLTRRDLNERLRNG